MVGSRTTVVRLQSHTPCNDRKKCNTPTAQKAHAETKTWNVCKALTARYTIGTNAGIGTVAHTRWKHVHRKGGNFVAAPSMQTS